MADNLFHAPVLRVAPLAVFASLPAGYSAHGDEPTRRQIRYADTHDWRLFRAGLLLEASREGARHWLRLRDLRSEEELEVEGRVTLPCLLPGLPDGLIKEALVDLVECRALLESAVRDGRFIAAQVRDAEDKLVLRASLELTPGTGETSDGAVAVARIELRPLRGYPQAAQHARAALREYGALATEGGLEQAIWGRAPRSPSQAPGLTRSGVSAHDTAHGALAKVTRALLGVIDDCEAGVRDAIDIEFLHDYRVAVRRIRSVLRELPGICGADRSRDIGARLGDLGRLGGEVRDLDVLLEDMSQIAVDLCEAESQVVHDYFARERERLRGVLCKMLDSAAHRALIGDLRRIADSDAADGLGPDANRPIMAVLGAAFTRTHRRCLRDARRIKASTPSNDVHSLRKRCKRLRYLLDVFSPLYPREARTDMVNAFKSIQDDLGVYQDCDAQRAHLLQAGEALSAMVDGPVVDGEGNRWLARQGAIMKRVKARQQASLESFMSHFRKFDNRSRRRDVECLFGAATVRPAR